VRCSRSGNPDGVLCIVDARIEILFKKQGEGTVI
jgi:hypothetical protein